MLLLLSAGMFVAIAGFIIYRDGSKFHTAFYLLFLIPGLVCVAADPDVVKKMLGEPLGIAAVLFLGTIALSLLYPGVEVRPEIILVKIALILVSLFIISQFVAENTALFKKVLMLAVMAVALVAIFNMYEFYWVAQHPYSARMSGYYLVENPLFLAGTFGSFFIAAIYLVIEYRRNILMVFLMMSSGGALMLAVVATQCRSFFVAVLAALVLPYFRKGRVTILVLLSLALIVFVAAVYLNPALLERTEFPRFQIWKYSLELIGERPFYGWGSDYDPTITVTGLPLSDTHNILLTVWLKYGALSLVALLLLLGYASFVVMNNLKNETLRLGGALLLFGVTMLFFEGHDIIAKPNRMWMMVWVPLGIVMGAMHAQNTATGSGKVAS
jgi:O-antigen ligase